MNDQKTTEPGPSLEPVESADDDRPVRNDPIMLLDEASKNLAVQARAEAELGEWVAGPNELQRLEKLERLTQEIASDVRGLRRGELGPGQLVPQHQSRLLALEAACGIKFGDGREVQDWTYEDGETGFDSVKAERDEARARVAELERAMQQAAHAYRP